MGMTSLMPLLLGVGLVVLLVMGLLVLFKAFYTKVLQGTALIVNDISSMPKMHLTGALVYPVIHLEEFMRTSLVTLEVDRRGKDGLICHDNMRAGITAAFYPRVNETQDDVLKVAKVIGVDCAPDRSATNELSSAKFSEALKTVGEQFSFVQLFESHQDFCDRIIEVIGNDLNGHMLKDVVVDYLKRTVKNLLDPNSILDAEGIRKITGLTATQNAIINELECNEEPAIKKKNVETREMALVLERQRADAKARQKHKIETIHARKEAETVRVKEEERLKIGQARIQTQQEIDVRTKNHQREVEAVQQNRQRAVVIEVERVTRAKDLEIVAREHEVELQKIKKEETLKGQHENIVNVIRERAAVRKTVTQEEERVKKTREVPGAEQVKQVILLQAQAEAEQELVRQIKQAEADEARSKHKAVGISAMTQAELEAVSKQVEAKKRLTKGIEVRRAAPSLADTRALEITAAVKEKGGLAAAQVRVEQLIAEARGDEERGPTDVRVLETQATAREKDGLAEARVLAEKLDAQVRDEEQLGAVKAKATKGQGSAEAEVLLQRLNTGAEGLGKKFSTLDAFNDSARQHEESRIQLKRSFEETMTAIVADKDIVKDQAEVLTTVLGKVNIKIAGGKGDFFSSFAKSLSVDKAIEGAVDKNPVVQGVFARPLNDRGAAAAVMSEHKNGHEDEPAAGV